MKLKLSKFKIILISVLLLCIAFYFTSGFILCAIGNFLIRDDIPAQSDAIVVLNTGAGYNSRLKEAADLYHQGLADRIIINGNRKMDIDRILEKKGFEPCCPWYENRLRVLSLYNVPRNNIVYISAEDVYDSVGEAEIVGNHIKNMGIQKIIITTSKYHTRRANFIWKKLFADHFRVTTVSAKTDPFDPAAWWHDGRQIRWLLAEYGAWIYYYWKRIKEI